MGEVSLWRWVRKSSRIPLSDFRIREGSIQVIMLSMQHFTNYSMDYKRYLRIQWRLEWFYDFHPEFFDDIPPEKKKLLQETFLYDTPDEGYPESLRDFYDEKISNNKTLHKEMLLAVDVLYRTIGVGSFFWPRWFRWYITLVLLQRDFICMWRHYQTPSPPQAAMLVVVLV